MKILYVSTISSTVTAFMIPHIKMLVDEGHQVELAFNVTMRIPENLAALVANVYNLPFQRNPIKVENLKAYKQLRQILKDNKYDLVHTHTPVASALTRIACVGHQGKVFYTAHGFHFFKGAPLLNWLIYFPVEWVLSFFTDVLITINEEDFSLAKKRLHAKVTEYVPGVGVDVAKFRNVKLDVRAKRAELGIPEDAFVLLSVGELNENKNHRVILKALAECQKEDILYLICGKGELEDELKLLAQKLGVGRQVRFMGYRDDVPELMKVVDAFIHPSFREGLPVALMEAMASGLPCIASKIRGNVDLLQNESQELLCAPKNVEAFTNDIRKLYNDKNLAVRLSKMNLSAIEAFELNAINNHLFQLYKVIR